MAVQLLASILDVSHEFLPPRLYRNYWPSLRPAGVANGFRLMPPLAENGRS